MPIVLDEYVLRAKGKRRADEKCHSDWWRVKDGKIEVDNIQMPIQREGQRVRLKIEIVEE